MEDQVHGLQSKGVAADFLSSTRTAAQRTCILQDLRSSQPSLKLLFVTPELLATDRWDSCAVEKSSCLQLPRPVRVGLYLQCKATLQMVQVQMHCAAERSSILHGLEDVISATPEVICDSRNASYKQVGQLCGWHCFAYPCFMHSAVLMLNCIVQESLSMV